MTSCLLVPWVVFIYGFHCICTVYTHCCVLHCMHVDLPAHMYIRTCMHTYNLHTLHYMYICSVLKHWTSCISLAPPMFSSHLSKILSMFLHSKSLLLNGNILHLILSLVGTLDSEHKCIEIPYPQTFKDLLDGEQEPCDSVKQAGEY